MDYQIIGLGDVYLTWQPESIQYSPDLQQLAATTWTSRPLHVFNGDTLIYQAAIVNPNRIDLVGRYTEYQFYYAQKRTQTSFGIAPIAVSGMILCQEHLVLGQRSLSVTSYPGWWELAPAGAIDKSAALPDGTADFIGQLTQEFTEEIGLGAEVIRAIHPFGVTYDPNDPVYDIICKIDVEVELSHLLETMRSGEEYMDALAIPLAEVPAWLEQHQTQLIPPSQAILAIWSAYVG